MLKDGEGEMLIKEVQLYLVWNHVQIGFLPFSMLLNQVNNREREKSEEDCGLFLWQELSNSISFPLQVLSNMPKHLSISFKALARGKNSKEWDMDLFVWMKSHFYNPAHSYQWCQLVSCCPKVETQKRKGLITQGDCGEKSLNKCPNRSER